MARQTEMLASQFASNALLAAPLKLVRLGSAKVIWRNEREFPNCRVVESLFGFCALPAGKAMPEEAETVIAWADRYGSTSGLTPHGGAGRAALVNGWYVKGIGATPLVGRDANGLHADGCMWLEEAVRELILSRASETFLGSAAQSIVAVIDTGLSHLSDGVWRRRALVVRPFAMRIAHLQRALSFQPHPTHHLEDVARVQLCEQIACKCEAAPDMSALLEGLAASLGRTLGLCHANAFFQGGVTSGNVRIDGGLIDLGGARFVRSSQRASFEERGQYVGDEVDTALFMIDRLIDSRHVAVIPRGQRVPLKDRCRSALMEAFASAESSQSAPSVLWDPDFRADSSVLGCGVRAAVLSREEIQNSIKACVESDGTLSAPRLAKLLASFEISPA